MLKLTAMGPKKTIFVSLLAAAFLVAPFGASAQSLSPSVAGLSGDLTVTPVVVDEKAKARDILKETLTIKNNTSRLLQLFPSVNNIHKDDGEQQFSVATGSAGLMDSLANWIEISRGVIALQPGQSVDIPFIIRVNLNALPGTYHADISFYEGSTRSEAEARRPLSVVTVNTEVQAEIKEALQLNKFITDSFFFSGDDILFNFQLQNVGNQELKPKGEIRIYDRSGHEVASVPVNGEAKSIAPDQAAQLASAWSAAKGFGKFKAFLDIDYGNQNGTLQDTVYFWIIPWQQLLIIFGASLIAIIIAAIYFHRWLEHRHMQKFAAIHGVPQGAAGASFSPTPAPKTSAAAATAIATPVAPKIQPVSAARPKKQWFAFMRRAKKIPAQAAVLQSIPGRAIASASPAPATPVTRAQLPAHTIDLSAQISVTEPQKPNPDHVINLKDGA